jgi:site-specific DNA-methyltransferase (adenine-specific)
MSGGNKPTSEGNYQILSTLRILEPAEACSETYLILDVFDDKNEAERLVQYMSGKLSRFLLLQALTSIHITKDKFCFVPSQDYMDDCSDKILYVKYGLTSDEVDLVETTIKAME